MVNLTTRMFRFIIEKYSIKTIESLVFDNLFHV